MTPFFPSEFVPARTTPCVTRSAAEGVSVAMHAGHIVISIVQNDGSGMAVVLDSEAADQVAHHFADAVIAMTRREAPSLKLVQ
ncbi:hypothetical protein [Sphingobium sp.]|uniref:hypothetical protein n=1 Tax=Sphingobium sp. TaxID=1912891 RepID=UPI0026017DBE|nr:hypothetical protein [Sphingobium sp.]